MFCGRTQILGVETFVLLGFRGEHALSSKRCLFSGDAGFFFVAVSTYHKVDTKWRLLPDGRDGDRVSQGQEKQFHFSRVCFWRSDCEGARERWGSQRKRSDLAESYTELTILETWHKLYLRSAAIGCGVPSISFFRLSWHEFGSLTS